MSKKECFWYVKPLNSHTNEVISRQLPESDFDRSKNLWECSLEYVKALYESRQDLNLKLEIWGKQGHGGKIINKTFLFNPKHKRLKMSKKKKLPPKR